MMVVGPTLYQRWTQSVCQLFVALASFVSNLPGSQSASIFPRPVSELKSSIPGAVPIATLNGTYLIIRAGKQMRKG